MSAQTGQARVGSGTKKIVLIVILLAAVLPVLFFIFSTPREEKTTQEPQSVGVGDKAPDFVLTGLDGRQVHLADLAGKIVILHFWATWCPPCVEEMPTLNKIAAQLPSADFALLAASVDDGGAAAVSSFMQRNRLSMPVFLDQNHSVSSRYGTFKFPETYLIGRDGLVKYKIIGPRDWTDPETLNALKELAARS